MNNKVKQLISEYLTINNVKQDISTNFIQYISYYTQPSPGNSASSCEIYKELEKKNKEAKDIYSSLINLTEIEKKLTMFLIKSSDLRKYKRRKISVNKKDEIEDEICRYIKKGALGFKIGYFNDIKLFKLKDCLDLQVYEIIFQVYQNSNIYKKLKSGGEDFQSKAHINFFEVIKKELSLYEESVITQSLEHGLLGFHLGMWKVYLQLQFINQLNECFRDNPKNPFEFLKLYENNFNKNLNVVYQDNIIQKCSSHLNNLINEFISTGSFRDTTNEFFIAINSNNNSKDLWEYYVIDYGLIPYFIPNNLAQKIFYIGKCLFLINKIERFTLNSSINILETNLENKINVILNEVNIKINDFFIKKNNIMIHLQSAKDIFLFGRSDFIETLLFYIKDYSKPSNRALFNRSMSFILEKALIDTFKKLNGFSEKIDICILDNENKWDYISLFCQLEFPINIIFTKEIIMKLVAIFKFLWRTKKIENLLRQLKKKNLDTKGKIRIIEYLNLIYKLLNYIFEGVIEHEYVINIEKYEFIVDELRKKLNITLDSILLNIFQVSGQGKEEIDVFLGSLENMCLLLGRSDIKIIQDQVTRDNLNDFIKKNSDKIKGTALHDLIKFV